MSNHLEGMIGVDPWSFLLSDAHMPEEHKPAQTADIQALQQLFEETDAWLGDLDFRSDEIRFYWKVAGRYLKSIDPETTDRVEAVQEQLSRLEVENMALKKEVLSYRMQLNQRLQARDDHSSPDTEIHADVQTKVHTLDRAFRNFKDDVFAIANDVFGD